jgi:hypothetical protein
MKTVAIIDGIKLKLNANIKIEESDLHNFPFKNLPKEIKYQINKKKKSLQKSKNTLSQFTNPIRPEIKIDKETYNTLLNIQNSVITNRSITDNKYIQYLFQSLTKKELKQLAKDFKIRGYSKMNRIKLIEFLSLNLTDEEIRGFIIENEQAIISKEIALSKSILNGKYKEKLVEIRIINPDTHELDLKFEGFDSKWTTKSFLIINSGNIDDPERFCDCIKGEEGGFCPHFWVGFMKAYKLGYFKMRNWKLTYLPHNFKEHINDLKI